LNTYVRRSRTAVGLEPSRKSITPFIINIINRVDREE
jgi:hypothetical protein